MGTRLFLLTASALVSGAIVAAAPAALGVMAGIGSGIMFLGLGLGTLAVAVSTVVALANGEMRDWLNPYRGPGAFFNAAFWIVMFGLAIAGGGMAGAALTPAGMAALQTAPFMPR